ncbi:MAG: TonB-dependent receptor [Bacteroidetes bacterium]|nr:TonB-dependent receptor [Bacteroidota bacterium]
MKKYLPLLFLLCAFHLSAQTKFSISGYVRDSTNGESIHNARVYNPEFNIASNSNNYGFYSLELSAGTPHLLRVSAPGMSERTFTIILAKDTSVNFYLMPSAREIKPVDIRVRKNDNVRTVDISTQTITSQTIREIPAFLGEADVIKSVQLLPGVTTVGEGATGFNVRGGGIDQNLVLMDEAPVFNSAHLFGFFSIFNPDAVKDVQLVKGGIPANYGGRLSSTLDVRMKDGNNQNFQANGGVGTIFSRLTVEGPIAKNKASFLIAGRRSYIDVLAKPFLKGNLKESQFYFYDFTGKVNWNYKRDKFYISTYIGDDAFSAQNAFGVKWGNSTITGRWNHVFNKKLFGNFTYFYSRYRYNIEFSSKDANFNWQSYIVNNSAKADFNYYANSKHEILFGGQSTYYVFKPGRAVVTNKGDKTDFSLPDKYGLENAIYIAEEYNPSGKFSYRLGLRLSNFMYMGQGKAYYYKPAANEGDRRVIDHVKEYKSGEIISQYTNLEPRFGFKYELDKNKSIKGGYNRMVQNLHLISNTAASVPFDVWQPTTNNILPEKADQYTIGWFQNFGAKSAFETSVEFYYKSMKNQVDYVDGANLLLNEFLEGDLLTGIGRAYGTEFYLRKTSGKFTGWVSYTLSRSERKVNGVNDNKWYPNRFDRTHNVYVVANYKLNPLFTFAANFVLSSGTPTTFYSGQYTVQGYTVPDAGSNARNNVRNPLYHRLDLSITYNRRPRKHWESNWVISCYNVYNRRNPFSIYFSTDYQNKGSNEAIRYSVIGSFIPAVSYNFKWK